MSRDIVVTKEIEGESGWVMRFGRVLLLIKRRGKDINEREDSREREKMKRG